MARVAAPRRVVGASGRCQQLQDTYYSEEMWLAPGEMVYTSPKTTPVTCPRGANTTLQASRVRKGRGRSLGTPTICCSTLGSRKGRGTHGFRMTAGRGLQGKVPSAGGAQRNRVGWGLVRLLPLTDAPPNSLWASSEGEIVDGETLQSTPLTEIYDHHWILLNNVHKNRLCKGIEYVFGVGAESRNTPFDLPAGYGYPVAEGTEWGANIHLLRTEGLEGEDPYLAVKHCNECFYAPGKGDACNRQSNGTFQCCGDSCATGKTG